MRPKRICASTDLEGDFASIWGRVAEPTVGTQDSFSYMVDRTLMRPRDMLVFVEHALEVATNRGHSKIRADDIRHAEVGYSDTALLLLGYEIEDTTKTLADSIYSFHSAPLQMTAEEVRQRLVGAGVTKDDLDGAVELLIWFGFLGVSRRDDSEEEFAYQAQFNLRKLLHPVSQREANFVVHPGFRSALAIGGE